jgi:hypothetical protein
VALVPTRARTVAVASVLAVLGSLAAPLSGASAADPLEGADGPTNLTPNSWAAPIKDVVLQWDAIDYATKYEVQLSPNGDWTNNRVDLPNDGVTVATTYELPISVPHDEYFWRVRGLDAAAHSKWSAEAKVYRNWDGGIDILQAPQDLGDPTISWTPERGASLYRVRFSVDADFPSDAKLTATCWTANTTFTPYDLQSDGDAVGADCMQGTDLLGDTDYSWEVTAWDDSTVAALNADNAPDPSWDCAVTVPECDAATLITRGTFTYAEPEAGAIATDTVTGLTASWHDDAGNVTDCTGAVCDATPTFSWDAVAGANYYRVYVYRDPLASNVYRVYDTQWPTVTPRDLYFDDQASNGYYWKVVAGTCTNNENDPTCGTPVVTGHGTPPTPPTGDRELLRTADAFSAVETFGKQSGNVPLSKPDDGSTTTSDGLTFKWGSYFVNDGQRAYDVRNYRIQVAKDNDFDNVVWDEADIDMTQWTNRNRELADGHYFWRVQGIDQSGHRLPWSATFSFDRDATPPTFRLTDDNGVAVTANLHVAVDDLQLMGTVSQSTLHVVPIVGGGSALSGSWSKTSQNRWTFDPANPLVPGQSYGLQVVGGLQDTAGNEAVASGKTVRATVKADDKSPAWSFGSGWSKHLASSARGGTYEKGQSGETASVKFVGDALVVYGCRAPGLGTLVVKVDGTVRAQVNLKQGFTECGVRVFKGAVSGNKVHRLVVQAKNGPVDVDMAKTA